KKSYKKSEDKTRNSKKEATSKWASTIWGLSQMQTKFFSPLRASVPGPITEIPANGCVQKRG
ncbi:hypothetical protein SK128_020304, partial [Halocaridina rubra]